MRGGLHVRKWEEESLGQGEKFWRGGAGGGRGEKGRAGETLAPLFSLLLSTSRTIVFSSFFKLQLAGRV